MPKQNKRYPSVPKGKKLIFRWSYVHPRTGAIVFAHRRPFPILVDDVPQARPVKALKRKPERRPRTRTVKAFSIPPQHLTHPSRPKPVAVIWPPRVQAPRMSAVEVVPPTKPAKLHPGAHGEALDVFGALAGGIRAVHQSPAKQSSAATLFEALGGALAGAGATRVSAAIGQQAPQEHAKKVEDLVQMVGQHSPQLTQALRKLAEQFRQKRETEAGSNGSGLAEVGYFLLELFAHFGVGAVNGFPAGARVQLVAVDPSEKNIQSLVSNT